MSGVESFVRRVAPGWPTMFEEQLVRAAAKVAAEGLASLDLWWARVFGRPLSGRMYKLEMQTLFHGNTKDQEQI